MPSKVPTPDQATPARLAALEAEIRQLRQALARREARAPAATSSYRELFEQSADAHLILVDEHFVDCNRATVEMLRYRDKAELLIAHPSELSPPTQPDGRDSFSKANEMIALALERGSHRFEWDHRRADGEVFPVEVLLTAVNEPGRRVLHVVWRDITERKRLEANLRHAHKMEAIGKLAGGIAHDFNNLLVAIVGNAELLREDLGDRDGGVEQISEILYASDRAAALVRQLLVFGRKQEVLVRPLDLNAHIRSARALLLRLIGEDIRLVTELAPEPLVVQADPAQLEQVLLNLASNSRDAMPHGGTLSLSTRAVTEAQAHPDPVPTPASMAGRWAELQVADSGQGMSAETAARAFEPFVTTKPVGAGTGLGLATVHSAVTELGGRVALTSEPGRGTVVTVWLPCVDAAASPQPVVYAERGERVGGSEHVLVVEDDAAVRATVTRSLRDAGYTVHEASHGSEALALLGAHGEEIALVLSDVIMPDMGGVQLFTALRATRLRPAVLFMSGYTDRALAGLANLGESVSLLDKPFTTGQLLARVRAAIVATRDGRVGGP
jgi:PAS domain S-box-containing protein